MTEQELRNLARDTMECGNKGYYHKNYKASVLPARRMKTDMTAAAPSCIRQPSSKT